MVDGCGRETVGNEAPATTRRAFVRACGAIGAGFLLAGPAGMLLSGCDVSATGERVFRGTRTWVDDAGRELTIPAPEQLERVYFTSALGQTFVFTINPDLMAGVSSRFTASELELLPARLGELKYLGSLSGGGEIDREALLVEKVQLVLSISGVELSEQNISDAEKLTDQTKIPVVLIDGSTYRIDDAYRELGDIFGAEERANELASYLEQIYADVTSAVDAVPDDQRVSLYYAEGPVGLQTEPESSQHAVVFKLAGARNVADVEETADLDLGMSNVSLEQVLAWDPEVIVAWDDDVRGGADERIRTNGDWANVRAVRDGRVYTMPDAPFAWCDRPVGVNRFIGLQWIANMLYPHVYDVDMVEKTKEFYALVYRADIDDAKARELLGNSYPPYGS